MAKWFITIITVIITFTESELSLGGSSPYTSTEKTKQTSIHPSINKTVPSRVQFDRLRKTRRNKSSRTNDKAARSIRTKHTAEDNLKSPSLHEHSEVRRPTIIPTEVLSLDAQMHAIDFAIPISRYRIFHPSTPVGKNQHLLSINPFIHLQQGSIHIAYRS
jgi:hypothetical protein